MPGLTGLRVIIPINTKRYAAVVALVALASALRVWPLQALGSHLAWLTFYPAVTVAAICGGLAAGLLATGLACLTVAAFWPVLVTEPFLVGNADWLGLAVFVLAGAMISSVAEALRRANVRARLARLRLEDASRARSAFLANKSAVEAADLPRGRGVGLAPDGVPGRQ